MVSTSGCINGLPESLLAAARASWMTSQTDILKLKQSRHPFIVSIKTKKNKDRPLEP
jgi:hypothetical protein